MKTERFESWLDRETLERMDLWRSEQPDYPSRAEAVRRLVEVGLTASRQEMERISDGEKLILMALRDLWRQQKVKIDEEIDLEDEEIDLEFVCDAISRGHEWALECTYPSVFEISNYDRRTVSEVVDVLEMWSLIEKAYARLSEAGKKQVEMEAEPFGQEVKFKGFSVNDEVEYYSIADFLINKMKRFDHFKDRKLNSHYPCVDVYRRMLVVFRPMSCTISTQQFSVSDIINLLKEQIHPEYRK